MHSYFPKLGESYPENNLIINLFRLNRIKKNKEEQLSILQTVGNLHMLHL